MPFAVIARVIAGGPAFLQDTDGNQFSFTFDKISEYRGEYQPSELTRFGPNGLAQGSGVYFEHQAGKIIFVRPITDWDLISARRNRMTENEQRLYAQARSEGYKDEVCPDCKTVLLAFHHFIRCDRDSCAMKTRNNSGLVKNLLEALVEPK